MRVVTPSLLLENLLDRFSTLRLLQLVSSEKGVGKIREGRGDQGDSQSQEQRLLDCQSRHLCASHCTEEDPHSGRTPGLKPRTVSSCAASSHRRDLPAHSTVACSRGSARPLGTARCFLGPRGSSPRRGAAAGTGGLRSWVQIRLFGSSLLLPGFIVCGAFWGGEGAAPPPPPRPPLLLRSLARRARQAEAGEWMRSCLPRQRFGLPRPLPAETSQLST